jgi:hypothetical protein
VGWLTKPSLVRLVEWLILATLWFLVLGYPVLTEGVGADYNPIGVAVWALIEVVFAIGAWLTGRNLLRSGRF